MKYFIQAACMGILFISCNDAGKKAAEQKNDTAVLRGETNTTATISIQPVKLTTATLPPGIRFKGKLYEAWQWTDKLGENLLVTSVVEPYNDKEKDEDGESGQSAELHAFHFIKKDTSYKLLWKIIDAVKICPFDITCGFIKDATTVTDLNNNGIAETTVQYSLACRSDVSPAYMKLIMHEDTVKYSLRGAMWLKSSPEDSFTVTESTVNLEKLPKKKDEYEQAVQGFGRYENEKEFAAAPPAFLTYARSQWMKHVKEKMGLE